MRPGLAPPLVLCLALLASAAIADQIRLRDGRVLQGEVVADRSDEEALAIRLLESGGVIRVPWKDLVEEDRKRLRIDAGLERPQDEREPTVAGHRVLLSSGSAVLGLAENPEETDRPLVLKTAEGRQTYPRSAISSVEPVTLPALTVYTPEELHGIWLAEDPPATPAAHVALADRCFEVGAYAAAKRHYESGLEGVSDPGRAADVRKRLRVCETLIEAEDLVSRKERVRRLALRNRFQEALGELDSLRKAVSGRPALERLLELDRLEERIRRDRHDHLEAEILRRAFREIEARVREKVRAKGVTSRDALGWAERPNGLAEEVFAGLSRDLAASPEEVRRVWTASERKKVRRFAYGPGTALHPEEVARARRSGKEPVSADEWWAAASPSDRELLVAAWFAEFGGVLAVERVETRTGAVRERIVVCR